MRLNARLLPFLHWPPLAKRSAKADLVAGITVALVLIPQSMAYAQLGGLPAYFGLYAAFLPGIVAALWGSSKQLATGPVAVVSLLTASSLAPFAAIGTEKFIAMAILLSMLVGFIQLLLGVFRLGVVVNFLSHPVIVGFTNAAAIIIGLSQLSKLLGLSMGRTDSFLRDVWGVVERVGDTHLPTLIMGIAAFAIMWGLKRLAPRLPGVLIAVALTTLVSGLIGFEHNGKARIDQIADPQIRTLAEETLARQTRLGELEDSVATLRAELNTQDDPATGQLVAALNYEIDLLQLQIKDAEKEVQNGQRALRKFAFARIPGASADSDIYYAHDSLPPAVVSDGHRWRIASLSEQGVSLVGGGAVVGQIPRGLPNIEPPSLQWGLIPELLPAALVISLVGFMEAISIAKAMAARTRDRIDPNQELIGQGLANVVGSFSQAYPVSGSFSRSAVNLNAGAVTGLSSVVAGIVVLITLLFLTPLLYHLPQAVLAAVIMMAVVGLVNFAGMKHAWNTHKHDGIASAVTFIATLVFAPELDIGILIGVALAVGLYLYRTMKPRVALLGRYRDGTFRDIAVHPSLPTDERIVVLRFDGSLYFANVAYFEDAILEAVSTHPKARFLLILGDSINQLDASGEEVLHHLVERLESIGVTLVFSGLKKQIRDIMLRTDLSEVIRSDNLFSNADAALDAIYAQIGAAQSPEDRPLKSQVYNFLAR